MPLRHTLTCAAIIAGLLFATVVMHFIQEVTG